MKSIYNAIQSTVIQSIVKRRGTRRDSDFNTQAITYDSQAILIAITRSMVKHDINTQAIAYDSQENSIAITISIVKQSRSIDFNTEAIAFNRFQYSSNYNSV